MKAASLDIEMFRQGGIKPAEIAEAIEDPKYGPQTISALFTGSRLTVPLVKAVAIVFGVEPRVILEEVQAGMRRRVLRAQRKLG